VKSKRNLVEKSNFQGNTALNLFFIEDLHEAASIMIKNKPDPLQICGLETKTNPFNTAAKYGDIRMLEIILSGIDSETMKSIKKRPLCILQ
jgi:hypothetical protein